LSASCSLLAFFKGLYHDIANGITKGTCGPLLIHADKTKTKEKEAEERVRQQTQEKGTETKSNSAYSVIPRRLCIFY